MSPCDDSHDWTPGEREVLDAAQEITHFPPRYLTTRLDKPRQTISRHLRSLVNAGVIERVTTTTPDGDVETVGGFYKYVGDDGDQ